MTANKIKQDIISIDLVGVRVRKRVISYEVLIGKHPLNDPGAVWTALYGTPKKKKNAFCLVLFQKVQSVFGGGFAEIVIRDRFFYDLSYCRVSDGLETIVMIEYLAETGWTIIKSEKYLFLLPCKDVLEFIIEPLFPVMVMAIPTSASQCSGCQRDD